MKRILLLTFSLLLSISPVLAGEKEDAFRESFTEAIATSDEALFALVEFSKNGNPLFDQMMRESLSEGREKIIKEMKFQDLPEDAITEFTYDGVDYIPTLSIEKQFVVSYQRTDEKAQVTATTYNLGTKDGSYKIVTSEIKR